jgi:hypothetical protein
MALKRCRECGKEVSTEAAACPHCGATNPTGAKKSDASPTIGCAGCLGLIVIIIVVSSIGSGGSGASSVREEHSEAGAWTACQQFVESRLRAPSTADYPWDYPRYTTHLGSGKYRARAYVDAENGFSAKVRSSFDCQVQWDGGGTYRLIDLIIR